MNKPEDAPRDGTVILGHFGYPWFFSCCWSLAEKNWCVAAQAYNLSLSEQDPYFENEWLYDDDLKGWLPMPDIE